jgi:hypothetical protein
MVCDEWESVKMYLNVSLLKAWEEGFETINKNGFVIWNTDLDKAIEDKKKYKVDIYKKGHQKQKKF